MRIRLALLLTSLASLCSSTAIAQAPQQQPTIRVQDGGTSGRMESIFIPPKVDAPFGFTLVTEWARPMNNGGSFTLTNERHIVRDSKGRIYQERWILVPKGGNIKSWMDVFQITDPEKHIWYNCLTKTKVCDLYMYHLTTADNFQPPTSVSGPLADGRGFRQHEDLGLSSTEGQETHGYRETTTFNPGVMGNDKPMAVTREFWYSTHLGVNLISIVDEPMTGKQFFTAKELSTAEPDPSFFEVPADYKIVDRQNEKQ
jgi:hypothetical protein